MYNSNMNVATLLFFAIVLFVGRAQAVANSLKVTVEGELLPFNFSDNARIESRVTELLAAMAMRFECSIEVPQSQWVDWNTMIKHYRDVQETLLPSVKCNALKRFWLTPEKPVVILRDVNLTPGPSSYDFTFSLIIPNMVVFGTCSDCYKTPPTPGNPCPTSDWKAEFSGLFMKVQTSWPRSGQPLDFTEATIKALTADGASTHLFGGGRMKHGEQMARNDPQLLATMSKIKESLQTSGRLPECLKRLMRSVFYGSDSTYVAPNTSGQSPPRKRKQN